MGNGWITNKMILGLSENSMLWEFTKGGNHYNPDFRFSDTLIVHWLHFGIPLEWKFPSRLQHIQY